MIDRLLEFVAPHHCFGCGKIGTVLCANCKYNIVDEAFSGCIVCTRPSAAGICNRCKTTYEKAWCVGDREGVLERLINAYKFDRVRRASATLGALLDETLPVLPAHTVVVPVPTVRSHIRVRGYDHAYLVAREFAKRRKLRLKPHVSRSASTSQRGLNKPERMKEAKLAFYCSDKLDATTPYLVVDDVVTTNATLRYAAGVLHDAGATTIWAAVIARQPLDKQG